jgi:hypothetical protein
MHDLPQTTNSNGPLSSLEISGAISARVIHDLANLISGIIGNAEYAHHAGADSVNRNKALQAIQLSANNAGKLLSQCLPLHQLITREAFTLDASELADALADASGLADGWTVVPPCGITGRVFVQPRWLVAAVWQIAREIATSTGEISFHSGEPSVPVIWPTSLTGNGRPSEVFQVTISYRSAQPLFANGAPLSPDHYGLLAAQELISGLRGQILARPKPPGRQEVFVMLPLR